MKEVDAELLSQIGLTSADLPDYNYRADFDIGCYVAETAEQVILENQFIPGAYGYISDEQIDKEYRDK